MSGPGTGASLEAWVAMLSAVPIPVLRDSAQALQALRAREDEVTARDLSNAILRDPMLTLLVLRFLQVHRPSRRIVDITTIEHGVMMLGVGPFFRQFGELPVAEDLLRDAPLARQGLQAVVFRARHAAMHASRWAELRSDVETDEVAIAALLHDLAEMLLWLFAPQAAMQIAERMQAEPSLRSAAAQQAVLGFNLDHLQQALCRAWQLPDLLLALMDEQQAYRPRAQNALLAVALARHAAHGWWDAALPDDYAAIKAFLKLPEPVVLDELFRIALAAACEQAHSAEGRAAWLPPPAPFLEHGPREAMDELSSPPPIFERALMLLAAKPRPVHGELPIGRWAKVPARLLARAQLLALTLHAIHLGLGCARVVFLERAADALAARFVVGGRAAQALLNCRLRSDLDYAADALLLALRPQLGDCCADSAMAAALHADGETVGVIYADGGAGEDAGERLARFTAIVAALECALP